MIIIRLISSLALLQIATLTGAELKTGPMLPHRLVRNWAKLPPGWNFGECSSVSVDKNDNVWVYNRSKRPVIEFDKDGNVLQAWGEDVMTGPHGIKIDADGYVWTVDRTGQVLFKLTPLGRVLMTIGRVGYPLDNNSKDGFHDPTAISFAPNGDMYVSDGYVNSRVIKFNKDGEYLLLCAQFKRGSSKRALPPGRCSARSIATGRFSRADCPVSTLRAS